MDGAWTGRSKDASIELMVSRVQEKCGIDRVHLYADSDSDPFGASFRIDGIPAAFSVLTQDGALPLGQYDIQIENLPPGEYLLTGVVTLERLLEIIEELRGPMDTWPLNRW